MKHLRRYSILFLILAVSFGCDDDSTGPRALPRADSPDAVVELFGSAFDGRNLSLYASLLHEDFQFEFLESDAILSGNANGRWSRARELEAIESMFAGEPSRHGDIVTSIDSELIPVDPAWTDSVEPEFLGSQRRLYQANIVVGTADGAVYALRGDQELFVVEDGRYWKLLFHREVELAIPKAGLAESTLGRFKSRFSATSPLVAASPDRMVELFAHALRMRDYDLYDSLRHENYQFQFAADEFDLAGTPNGRWDRFRDSMSMQRLMSGQPSKDGEIVQGIELTMAPLSPGWTDQVEPEFEGSLRRSFQVTMDVSVSPGATTYQIRSQHEIYAIQQGEVWRILFYGELGFAPKAFGTETRTFGRLKSGY